MEAAAKKHLIRFDRKATEHFNHVAFGDGTLEIVSKFNPSEYSVEVGVVHSSFDSFLKRGDIVLLHYDIFIRGLYPELTNWEPRRCVGEVIDVSHLDRRVFWASDHEVFAKLVPAESGPIQVEMGGQKLNCEILVRPSYPQPIEIVEGPSVNEVRSVVRSESSSIITVEFRDELYNNAGRTARLTKPYYAKILSGQYIGKTAFINPAAFIECKQLNVYVVYTDAINFITDEYSN